MPADSATPPAPLPAPAEPPIASPCVSVCAIDPKNGYCIGCFRTIEEIAGWGSMSNVDKKRVVQELDSRFVD